MATVLYPAVKPPICFKNISQESFFFFKTGCHCEIQAGILLPSLLPPPTHAGVVDFNLNAHH
jgi:hypothetical protein